MSYAKRKDSGVYQYDIRTFTVRLYIKREPERGLGYKDQAIADEVDRLADATDDPSVEDYETLPWDIKEAVEKYIENHKDMKDAGVHVEVDHDG